MGDAALIGSLGPVTEARFAETFSKGALATLKDAASLVGLDEKTLKAMTGAGIVQGTPRGRLIGYSEVALRAYLLSPPAPQPLKEEKVTCQSTSRRKAASGTMTSSTKAVGFMDQRALRLAARRKRSSAA